MKILDLMVILNYDVKKIELADCCGETIIKCTHDELERYLLEPLDLTRSSILIRDIRNSNIVGIKPVDNETLRIDLEVC